ncbi:DUF2797 domain-containing protein [Aestuariibacter salexigens]|uniref:DUF2797 domain-containing protein n=1 Tax=Aestuariibacter salexigens TaxID=226010 RepID=UPI00047A645C|nr:DUF2797 domain-containing protein [Aestuariibacter salexigens]
MTLLVGNVRKMRVRTDAAHKAHYQLPVGDELIDMNAAVGHQIEVTFDGNIHCVHCNTKTKKSFNQGYCYRCLITLAQCDSCIIKPEKCHYHEGTCREPQWGEENCMQDHFVYLANTGTVKVGITRHVTDGVSSRWIDQGATQALPILRVKNRLVSGLVESVFKAHIADKTNWRTMLKGDASGVDLLAQRDQLLELVQNDIKAISDTHGLQSVQTVNAKPFAISYPVTAYPTKIKSINLDKDMQFGGELQGIKGQYLLLDGDRVINMRKYAGYHLSVAVS